MTTPNEDSPLFTAQPKPKRFAYKQLPTFNPTYYRAWATDVQDEFAERDWSAYLTSPTDTTVILDPAITVQAKAFLNQSISYEHKAAIEHCTTAAQIWLVFQQRYEYQSREDELYLEGQLLDFKKLATDTIDQHITKFDNLISSILAQQPLAQQYDNSKINRYFLRTLETANIKEEDWKQLIPFLGKTALLMTKDQLFAETRTYYNTHIQPYLPSTTKPTTPSALSQPPETKALAINTQSADSTNPANQSNNNNSNNNINNRGRGNYRGRGFRGRDRGHGRGFYNNQGQYNNNNNYGQYNNNNNPQRQEYPRDPNAWCNLHCKFGHSNEQCETQRQLTAQQSPQH